MRCVPRAHETTWQSEPWIPSRIDVQSAARDRARRLSWIRKRSGSCHDGLLSAVGVPADVLVAQYADLLELRSGVLLEMMGYLASYYRTQALGRAAVDSELGHDADN